MDMKNILGFAWAALACAGLGACSADAGDSSEDAGLLMSAGSKPGETTAKEGVVKSDDAPLEVGDTAEVQGAAVDNQFAVGVIPFDNSTCPADSQLVTFNMDDEDDANQTDSTSWEAPETARRALVIPSPIDSFRFNTTLRFCKVNGQPFRHLTIDVNNKSKFYAVLKLGLSCPNGSFEMSRSIDNEDDDNANSFSGPIDPNVMGRNTSLKFCYFHAGTGFPMGAFPSIGIKYGVFHDYDVSPQPSFVISKRWVYSDDEDTSNQNGHSPSGTTQANDFARIVGTGKNTMFDMARVR